MRASCGRASPRSMGPLQGRRVSFILSTPCHCRANSAHIRQSRPYSSRAICKAKLFKHFSIVSSKEKGPETRAIWCAQTGDITEGNVVQVLRANKLLQVALFRSLSLSLSLAHSVALSLALYLARSASLSLSLAYSLILSRSLALSPPPHIALSLFLYMSLSLALSLSLYRARTRQHARIRRLNDSLSAGVVGGLTLNPKPSTLNHTP